MGRGEGEGIFVLEEKGLPLGRGDMANRKMSVYKGVRLSWFILIGWLMKVAKRGLLIAELEYFASWTLIISLQRKKWSNKGIDSGG